MCVLELRCVLELKGHVLELKGGEIFAVLGFGFCGIGGLVLSSHMLLQSELFCVEKQ